MLIKYNTTIFDELVLKTEEKELAFVNDNGEENELVNLYPEVEYQKLEGFGGAITDAAGYVYSLLDTDQKKKLLESYFLPSNMKYNMVRMPIDSCDFSLGHYEAVSDSQDSDFKTFQLERAEQYIFPLLDDAEKVYGGKLPIMLTPWSPPPFMKTNGERNNGGSLKNEYRTTWAEYICKYITVLKERGYNIKRLSVQNEPKAVQTWDSCVYTAAEEKEFLRDYLYPALSKHSLTDIEIFIWDHNKERAFERADEIIDENTNHMIAGIALHWYSGDHFEALRMIKEKFPDKKLILSEACIEYSKFSQGDYLKNAQKYAHDMIGNLNEGMSSFYDWNLILDEQGGPNHVGNYCDAPFLFDTQKKELMEKNTAKYIWHFSHFIKKDARRIAFSRYCQDMEVTAFKNPDGTIIVVILNQTKVSIPINIRLKNQCVRVDINPEAIATYEITPD